MRRSSSSDLTHRSINASSSGDVGAGSIVDGLGPSIGGVSTNVGKVASALLAKHVRTLEVLHSLQIDNAKLRREAQANIGKEEIQRRIEEAVATAVASPNDLAQELQSQVERLHVSATGLQRELTTAREASAKSLDHASSQMDGLRTANQKLEKKCADFESEALRQARQKSCQAEVQSQLEGAMSSLATAQEEADDLTRQLRRQETELRALQLHLKEKEERCSALENAERTLQSLVDTESVRIGDLERQARELRDKLKEAENARKMLETRLEQALRDQEKSARKLADRATQEQSLRVKIEEQTARADSAEANALEERRRFHRLREEGRRLLEEETTKYSKALEGLAYEREQLIARIDALTREILTLRERMNNNRSQFSKYVEAKTENTHLKEELDGLREMITVPRPPIRSNSHGNNGGINAAVGGLSISSNNKLVGVERLRHSISVARGHNTNTKTFGGSSSSSNTLISGESTAATGKMVSVANAGVTRRHSSLGGGGGWTSVGGAQAPSYGFSAPALSGSARSGEEGVARPRGVRVQQVF